MPISEIKQDSNITPLQVLGTVWKTSPCRVDIQYILRRVHMCICIYIIYIYTSIEMHFVCVSIHQKVESLLKVIFPTCIERDDDKI